MKFVNLHTHIILEKGQKGLINHPLQNPFSPEKGQYYSVGIHPWSIGEIKDSGWVLRLKEMCCHPQILAIGECGLDRSVKISIDIQKKFFISQLQIAEEKQMPVILHAVHTYSDLLGISKKRSPSVPWILHGYTGNAETTKQLLHHNFYFSFGESLLKNKTKLNNSLLEIPFKKMFFETDESSVPIECIYKFASNLLNKSVEELMEIVLNNFNCMFAKNSENSEMNKN